jgi:hypothetical protein
MSLVFSQVICEGFCEFLDAIGQATTPRFKPFESMLLEKTMLLGQRLAGDHAFWHDSRNLAFTGASASWVALAAGVRAIAAPATVDRAMKWRRFDDQFVMTTHSRISNKPGKQRQNNAGRGLRTDRKYLMASLDRLAGHATVASHAQ